MAIKRWIGDAIPVKQVDTITIAGTWAAGKIITLVINGKDLVLTVGSTVTTDSVANQLSAAINAGTATDGTVDTETRNIGGQEIPELQEVVASVASSVVSVTASVAGVPFTITSVTNDAAGTSVLATATAATGPNHFNNADNWTPSLPVNNDTVRFDKGNIDCLYALDYMRTNTLDFLFVRTTDYTGTIGLPEFNVLGYHEYRNRYLQAYDVATITTLDFISGEFGGEGGTTYLDCDGQTVTTLNIDHANRAGGVDVVEVIGGTISVGVIGRASVILDPEWSGASSAMVLSALFMGGKDIPDRETEVIIPTTSTLAVGFQLWMFGGQLITRDNLGTTTNIQYIYGGFVEIRGDGSAGGGTIRVIGGILSVACTGGITKVECWSAGTVNFGNTSNAPNVSTLEVYGGGHVNKNGKIVTHTLVGCTANDVFIEE